MNLVAAHLVIVIVVLAIVSDEICDIALLVAGFYIPVIILDVAIQLAFFVCFIVLASLYTYVCKLRSDAVSKQVKRTFV